MRNLHYIRLLIATALLVGTGIGQSAFAQRGASDQINREADRAPSIAALEREAQKAREIKDYAAAMNYYKHIVKADSANVRALTGYGEMAFAINAYGLADSVFRALLDRNEWGASGENLLSAARARKSLGAYAEAKALYQRFLAHPAQAGQSTPLTEEAQQGAANCDFALSVYNNTLLSTPVTLLGSPINTGESEFAPRLVGDALYYTTFDQYFKKDKYNPKRTQMRMMQAIPDAKAAEGFRVVPFDEINDPKRHTGHASFNAAGDVMYYSLCDYVQGAEIRCEIYMRRKNGKGWGAPVKLPESINMAGYNNTQPHVGAVPGSNSEVLYFVSDRPGGKGGKDIWHSRITGVNAFADPVNLTQVNTPGDEVTPNYHSGTATLYYSTNGLETVGGLDVYRVRGKGNAWTTPEHAGIPINSSANDVYFFLTPNGNTAYFSSNRNGAENISENGCCYDIFRADLVMPRLLAVNFNKPTGDSLRAVRMRLVELTPKGPVELVDVEESGAFREFEVLPGKKYMLISDKKYFVSDTVLFEMPQFPGNETYVQKLYLDPFAPSLVATVYDKDTKEPIRGATARFVEVIKPLPKPDVQTDPNGNRYAYPLEFEKTYKLVVSKPGYTPDSVDINTLGMTKPQVIEKQLYLQRGIRLEVFVFNEITKKPLNNVSFQLTNEANPNVVVDAKKNTTGNDYYSVLAYDNKFNVLVSVDSKAYKYPYKPVNVRVLTNKEALKSDDPFQVIRKEVYLRPLVPEEYLPITLYFDNDEPDKRTLATSTKKLYSDTYFTYYERKEEYVAGYSRRDSRTNFVSDSLQVDDFFENHVKKGWDDFRFFSEALYDILESGQKVQVRLRGFASPRSNPAYNLNLTARRVASVYNHFEDYDGGIYRKYIQSGQLTLIREPNGDKLSPPDVVKDYKDERNSIYNPKASKERRLQITGVSVIQN
ncbi:MAG: hypothetical protein ACK4NS_10905 [Saprospiraceae bacterium]